MWDALWRRSSFVVAAALPCAGAMRRRTLAPTHPVHPSSTTQGCLACRARDTSQTTLWQAARKQTTRQPAPLPAPPAFSTQDTTKTGSQLLAGATPLVDSAEILSAGPASLEKLTQLLHENGCLGSQCPSLTRSSHGWRGHVDTALHHHARQARHVHNVTTPLCFLRRTQSETPLPTSART